MLLHKTNALGPQVFSLQVRTLRITRVRTATDSSEDLLSCRFAIAVPVLALSTPHNLATALLGLKRTLRSRSYYCLHELSELQHFTGAQPTDARKFNSGEERTPLCESRPSTKHEARKASADRVGAPVDLLSHRCAAIAHSVEDDLLAGRLGGDGQHTVVCDVDAGRDGDRRRPQPGRACL